MANNIDNRIWDLGGWLEVFLDENVSPTDFLDLAKKAVAVLGVDYEVKADDPTLALIADIGANSRRLFENDAWGKVLSSKMDNEVHDRGLIDDATRAAMESNDRIQRLLEISHLRRTAIILLRAIKNSEKPWQQFIGELHESDENCLDYAIEPADLDQVMGLYGKLNEILIVRDEQIQKSTMIADPTGREEIPWDVFLSRILFDFLLLGGEERYGFCERCNRIFIIQRMGRKRFCSDICRVLASQEKGRT